MASFSGVQQTVFYRNRRLILLIFGSVSGYLFGVLPLNDDPLIASMMRSAASAPVSIVWLFAVMCFPLLLSACSVLFHLSVLLPVIAFAKSAVFSVCAAYMQSAFHSAGWLIRMLVMFSSITNLPVLYFFWLRHLDGEEASVWKDLEICLVMQAIIAVIDVLMMQPLLQKLTF